MVRNRKKLSVKLLRQAIKELNKFQIKGHKYYLPAIPMETYYELLNSKDIKVK